MVKFVLDLGIIIERQNCLTFKETVSSLASSFDRMARFVSVSIGSSNINEFHVFKSY